MGGIFGMYLQEVFLPQQVQYKYTENYFTIEIENQEEKYFLWLVLLIESCY